MLLTPVAWDSLHTTKPQVCSLTSSSLPVDYRGSTSISPCSFPEMRTRGPARQRSLAARAVAMRRSSRVPHPTITSYPPIPRSKTTLAHTSTRLRGHTSVRMYRYIPLHIATYGHLSQPPRVSAPRFSAPLTSPSLPFPPIFFSPSLSEREASAAAAAAWSAAAFALRASFSACRRSRFSASRSDLVNHSSPLNVAVNVAVRGGGCELVSSFLFRGCCTTYYICCRCRYM